VTERNKLTGSNTEFAEKESIRSNAEIFVISDRDLFDRMLAELTENRAELKRLKDEMTRNFNDCRQRISNLERRLTKE